MFSPPKVDISLNLLQSEIRVSHYLFPQRLSILNKNVYILLKNVPCIRLEKYVFIAGESPGTSLKTGTGSMLGTSAGDRWNQCKQ